MDDREAALRDVLGIPAGAERVIVFGESSHWDPNWLFTSREYYRLRIRSILDAVVRELHREPGRIFSLECLFFLRMYWERNPDRQDDIRELVNQGRMRLTGSGLTTPDTVLPSSESIIRDFLYGQEWLRQNGMTAEPDLAYFPDDFGHSPAAPDILAALGYGMAAVSRIDGMYFVGSDLRSGSSFPIAGSSAELLTRDLATQDFVWRGTGGGSVLCHWNAFTYFQGDAIALLGAGRWMGLNFGLPRRSANSIGKKIDSYVKQLAPLSRTPYMFCPIGCDFVGPVPALVSLLESYNQTGFPDTGVYAVNAGLDDYLQLVGCHRDRLPELELDMNPYWMGFYSSRPEMKKRCRKIGRDLVLAEKLLARAGENAGVDIDQELASAWDTLVVSNHHDFITGTSPGRVWKKEQRPWLTAAGTLAEAAVEKALRGCPAPPPSPPGGLPSWSLRRGRLIVETTHYLIELDESAGGCITRWMDPESGQHLLTGLGNDVVGCKDSGGLWRMGNEFAGGSFREIGRASVLPASIRVREEPGILMVEVVSKLEGRSLVRRMWFRDDSPVVRMSIQGSAAKRRAIACRFAAAVSPVGISMDVPGGVVLRPLEKIYRPTFWAASSFAHLQDHDGGAGMAVFLGGPGSVSANSNGVIEWIVLRNAPAERAFGIVPLPAHPAYGADFKEHVIDYGVGFTRRGDWRDNRLALLAMQVLSDAWKAPGSPDLEALAGSFIVTGDEGVIVQAIKRASRGVGWIARLFSPENRGGEVSLACPGREITGAALCDARERDINGLKVSGGQVLVPMDGTIVSVRLLPR